MIAAKAHSAVKGRKHRICYPEHRVHRILSDRYRCPERLVKTFLTGPLSNTCSYFRLGDGPLLYGRHASTSPTGAGLHPDLIGDVRTEKEELFLPFDPVDVVENLRHELYANPRDAGSTEGIPCGIAQRLYYALRPMMPFQARVLLQRIYFRGWNNIPFPNWPVDVSVEELMEKLLFFYMKAAGIDELPFIWFWPDGAASATTISHDVETRSGREFCRRLMDVDESFGFRSSFQIIPEERYGVSPDFLTEIRSRGHVVNIHDLNHDGRLFCGLEKFRSRVKAINEYGRAFGSKGFRSGALYRNLKWYDQLEFEYDMSVPNVAHLDAQRGGCCTVFPYFVGRILELPLTTTQDYSLFHILRDYSLDLWRAQAECVQAKHGLLSFLVHPDYILDHRGQNTYSALLAFLRSRFEDNSTWVATADDINSWWRQRSRMALRRSDGCWQIDGPGKDRARVAFAHIDGERIVYTRPS